MTLNDTACLFINKIGLKRSQTEQESTECSVNGIDKNSNFRHSLLDIKNNLNVDLLSIINYHNGRSSLKSLNKQRNRSMRHNKAFDGCVVFFANLPETMSRHEKASAFHVSILAAHLKTDNNQSLSAIIFRQYFCSTFLCLLQLRGKCYTSK